MGEFPLRFSYLTISFQSRKITEVENYLYQLVSHKIKEVVCGRTKKKKKQKTMHGRDVTARPFLNSTQREGRKRRKGSRGSEIKGSDGGEIPGEGGGGYIKSKKEQFPRLPKSKKKFFVF
jgi:hypothetical protein